MSEPSFEWLPSVWPESVPPVTEPKSESKSGTSGLRDPLPSDKPVERLNLQQSYLDAFLKNDVETMSSLKAKSVRDKDTVKALRTSREQRKNNVVVINFPKDPRINSREQYLDFLVSLDVISLADKVNVRDITQRDSKRNGKKILTISFDASSGARESVLANSDWSKNKCLPTWGISVFPDLTHQERMQQLQNPVSARTV